MDSCSYFSLPLLFMAFWTVFGRLLLKPHAAQVDALRGLRYCLNWIGPYHSALVTLDDQLWAGKNVLHRPVAEWCRDAAFSTVCRESLLLELICCDTVFACCYSFSSTLHVQEHLSLVSSVSSGLESIQLGSAYLQDLANGDSSSNLCTSHSLINFLFLITDVNIIWIRAVLMLQQHS